MADPLGVSVGFDDPWNEPDPTWTRIDTLSGCRVRGWSIDRGRPDEFSKTDTGTAVIQIVDRDGLFDPTNATSPYVGKILPGKQAAVALQNPIGDVWHTLFRGFVESWHYRLDQTRQYMELELQLVDGFAVLARAELRVGVDGVQSPFAAFPAPQQEALAALADGNILYGETASGYLNGTLSDRIEAVLGDVGWPTEWSIPWHTPIPGEVPDLFSGNVRVGPKAYGPGTSALDALWDAVDAEWPGVANLWISKEGHLEFRGRQARFRPDVAEYGINERTVSDDASAYDPELGVVQVSELEWSLGEDNLFNAVSATPQWIGSGATIRQLNPDLPHNDDIEGQWEVDTASVTEHGRRSLTFDQLQTVEGIATGNNSMVETKLFASFYVNNYSTPAPRITRMMFKSRRPGDTLGPSLWLHMCRCEISDLLTLQTEHPGGGGFDDQFFVEGIHYTGRPGTPDYPIIELALDVSPRAHYTDNPFDADTDPDPW